MDNLSISVGRNRKETKWINKVVTWEKFLSKLEKCELTDETVAQYAGMAAAAQAEIKDVGGFVGGRVEGGRRRRGSVPARSMITLDIDFAPVDIWDQLELDYNCAMALYSTHKHTTEKPRLRLVVPLDREVSADQYEAIARLVAADIGMGYFDPTTFEVERLMYWPSMPKDGQYVFEKQDGAPMDADRVLARYADWSDVSSWPVAPGETRGRVGGGAVAPDPRTKDGVIGAFCRVYDPARAIGEILDGVYELNGDGRYTYARGTSHGGMIVLPDGQYVRSYHGTDPAGGGNRNAFDLVRIHKFGSLDDDMKEGTPVHKRPSYAAMVDFALGLPDVKIEMVGGARAAFADVEVDTGEDWRKKLKIGKNGIHATTQNISIILENDPAIKRRFAYNEFTNKPMIRGHLPWEVKPFVEDRPLTDNDDYALERYIEDTYGLSVPLKILKARSLECAANTYHPVRQYLNELKWDGNTRIEEWLIKYLGADDTPLTRIFSRKVLAAAVARIMEPGIKFDYVLVLSGTGGAGKSTLLNSLGREWYSDKFGKIDNKTAMENLQGVWIMEINELAEFRKREADEIKDFISNRRDRFRPAYGRHVVDYPRQSIFIGTTNTDNFLKDQTGNRRFWPVEVQKAGNDVFEISDVEVNQLWAEAVEVYKAGEKLYLTAADEKLAEKQQEIYTITDPHTGMVLDYLDKLLPAGWDDMNTYDRRTWLSGDNLNGMAGTIQRQSVTIAEIWFEVIPNARERMTSHNTQFIADILRRSGTWVKKGMKRSKIYGRQYSYVRALPPETLLCHPGGNAGVTAKQKN